MIAAKTYRVNSCIYSTDTNKLLSHLFSIDRASVASYKKACIRLGILQPVKGHWQFINIKKACEVLFDDYRFINRVDLKITPGINKIKFLYDNLKLQLGLKYFRQQQYMIRKKQEVVSLLQPAGNRKLSKSSVRKVKAMSKEYGCSLGELPQCISRTLNTKIVTGKNAFASVMGCSSSTAIRLLNKWDESKDIIRKPIMRFLNMPVTHSTFDHLKANNNSYILPKKNGFMLFKGSEITLLD